MVSGHPFVLSFVVFLTKQPVLETTTSRLTSMFGRALKCLNSGGLSSTVPTSGHGALNLDSCAPKWSKSPSSFGLAVQLAHPVSNASSWEAFLPVGGVAVDAGDPWPSSNKLMGVDGWMMRSRFEKFQESW